MTCRSEAAAGASTRPPARRAAQLGHACSASQGTGYNWPSVRQMAPLQSVAMQCKKQDS